MKTVIEQLEAIASKKRGNRVTISIENGSFIARGCYSYFPEGKSSGTATTVENAVLVNVKLIDNLYLAGSVGTTTLAGLSEYEYDIQKLLGRDIPDCVLKIVS